MKKIEFMSRKKVIWLQKWCTYYKYKNYLKLNKY